MVPEEGSASVRPTEVIPGLAASRSRTARWKRSTEGLFGYWFRGNWYSAMSTWSGRKPGSTERIFWKLRRNAPETVSKTNAAAISETTRAERSQEWLDVPVPVPAPSFRPCEGLVRRAAKAGARLHKIPVATASRKAKFTTFASIEIELTRGMESGRR